MKNHVILVALFFLATLSCSKKLTPENLDKPFYNDLKKNIIKVYHEYNDSSISFKEFYDDGRYEVERDARLRKRVIDSLGLMHKEKWMLIELSSTNYSGLYENTYIFFDNKCVFYNLSQYGLPEDFNRVKTGEVSIESLKGESNNDIYEIYQAFQRDKFLRKLNIQPDTNPLFSYDILFVKDGRIKSYKLSSKDYIIKNW